MSIRLLIDYAPYILRPVREYQALCFAGQPEIDDLWTDFDHAWDDQYFISLTENGISKWEKMLGFTPLSTDTLDDRRNRIIAKFLERLPYTFRQLQNILAVICGAGNFDIDKDFDNYHISVFIKKWEVAKIPTVDAMLRRILPCNLGYLVEVRYNRHVEIGKPYIHEDFLAERYTHQYLHENELLKPNTWEDASKYNWEFFEPRTWKNLENYNWRMVANFTWQDFGSITWAELRRNHING